MSAEEPSFRPPGRPQATGPGPDAAPGADGGGAPQGRARKSPPPFDSGAYQRDLTSAVDRAFAGLDLPERARDLLAAYGTLLAEKSRTINLTRLTDPADMAVLHFLDTYQLTRVLDDRVRRVIDIGSGGGVPGLPLAILRPGIEVVLIDGTGKKVACLREFIAALGLENARAVHARAEEHFGDRENRYDLGVLRAAVKPERMMDILAQHRGPLEAVAFMLGSEGRLEARRAGGRTQWYRLEQIEPYRLPGRDKVRFVALFGKHHRRGRRKFKKRRRR